ALNCAFFYRPRPRGKKRELSKQNLINLIRKFPPSLDQGCRNPPHQFPRPFEIVSAIITDFQGSKERVIFQPVRLILAELIEGDLQLSRFDRGKVGPGFLKQSVLELDNRVIIDGGSRKRWCRVIT